ncbi:MAG: hypothetical protein ACLPN1_06755 [Dissulfurispiraceae bacterium]
MIFFVAKKNIVHININGYKLLVSVQYPEAFGNIGIMEVCKWDIHLTTS